MDGHTQAAVCPHCCNICTEVVKASALEGDGGSKRKRVKLNPAEDAGGSSVEDEEVKAPSKKVFEV